jgi:MFS family permease
VLVALTNAMSLLDRQILAILAPAIKHDLGVGDAEMGLLFGTVFALFYALFSLPVGRLADGWLRGRLLGVSILFWSASTALAGMTSSFAMLATVAPGRRHRRGGDPAGGYLADL